MHPSNKVTLENLKEVVYWHRPNADAIAKFERIAKACEDAIRAFLTSDKTVDSYEGVAAEVRKYQQVIEEIAPDCSDRQTAIDLFYSWECPHEDQSEENFQEDIRTMRKIRMWANSSIALDPASALPIDHERK